MKLTAPTEHYCALLASAMRDCDRHELSLARPGEARIDIVVQSVADSVLSEAILTDSGDIAGIWGVAPHPIDNVGSIWMLASDLIRGVSLPFLRECPNAIGRAHAHFDTLVCAPWRGNALHLTWLRWCGFQAVELNHEHFLPHVRTYNHPDAHVAGSVSGRGGSSEQRHEQGD